MSVGGIVLAAGRSERMGRPKALLTVSGRSFISAAVAALRTGGCDPVVVVVADPEPGTGVGAAALDAGADAVATAPADGEQVDSLRAGLRALAPTVAAAVVLPVDHPLVVPATVRALIAAHDADAAAIVRPTHGGRPGHPTLFPAALWPRLLDASLPRGARTVLDAEDVAVRDVPVPDEGVLADIDTPERYRRWIATP